MTTLEDCLSGGPNKGAVGGRGESDIEKSEFGEGKEDCLSARSDEGASGGKVESNME